MMTVFTVKSKAAAFSVASNTFLILLKIVAGLITGSISLIAEAVHSMMDLAAALIAFFSVRISDTPPDEKHPFGHGKWENISGVAEALLIFVAAGIIVYQAVQRLIAGKTLESLEIGIGIMAVAIVVNVLVSRYLFKVSRKTDSIALEADARHLTTDVMTMAGVLLGLAIVQAGKLTGHNLNIFDPIAALLVALLIMRTAYELTMRSFGPLVDVKLPQVEEDEIISCIKEHTNQLAGFHEVRTRKSGSQRFIDLHLMLPSNASVEEAHQMCDHLEGDMKNRLPNSNVTIHVEPCNVECDRCLVSSCSLRIGFQFSQ
jgi:cation diffusion facilitator family transporter